MPGGWQGETVPVVTGEVTTILDDAPVPGDDRQPGRSDLAVFNAKRETFRANPRVMVAGEWRPPPSGRSGATGRPTLPPPPPSGS